MTVRLLSARITQCSVANSRATSTRFLRDLLDLFAGQPNHFHWVRRQESVRRVPEGPSTHGASALSASASSTIGRCRNSTTEPERKFGSNLPTTLVPGPLPARRARQQNPARARRLRVQPRLPMSHQAIRSCIPVSGAMPGPAESFLQWPP